MQIPAEKYSDTGRQHDDPWKGIEARKKVKQKLKIETCMAKKTAYRGSTRVKGEK